MTANDFPRCATCAHWQPDNTVCGTCSLFDIAGMSGMIFNINPHDGDAFVESVITSDTFGCINHSEITEEA